MRTLLYSQGSPLFFPNPFVWNPSSTFIQPTNEKKLINQPTTTWKWKLHANGKGFGSRSTPTSLKESASESASGNSNNNTNNEDHLPQVVLERIIVRILVSVGFPLATGIVLLHFLGIVKEKQLFDVPLWLPLLTTLVTFGMSAVGIAYGPLSSSWDAEKKGSFLGLEEAKQNWVEMWAEDDS